MISDRSLLLGCLLALVGACAADVPMTTLFGQARRDVTLVAPDDGEPPRRREPARALG